MAMTIRESLAEAVARLSHEPIGPPRMAAEALLMHVLGCDRAQLHAHPERPLSIEESQRFADVVTRRASGVPLQYITGHQEFYGLDFLVTPAVLIPRPETEHLVEAALDSIRNAPDVQLRIVDVGTGSGCIILALAHALRGDSALRHAAELHATDISAGALRVAHTNAERLGLHDIHFHQTDLLAALSDRPGSYDLVLSNPPYVGRCEPDKVQREVREHEPEIAVFGGEHGLDVYRRLIPQAHSALKPAGLLMMEIGYSIEAPVRSLLDVKDWSEVRAVPDLQGIPRIVIARKRE
jgi:release factor glutamine methyltransferase